MIQINFTANGTGSAVNNLTVINKTSMLLGYHNITVNILDITAPTIMGLVNLTTNMSANVSFTTDEPANATIVYGIGTAYNLNATNSSYLTNHFFELNSLVNGTLYSYNITVCNSVPLCNIQSHTFTTNP